jgi:hypothetical protein
MEEELQQPITNNFEEALLQELFLKNKLTTLFPIAQDFIQNP